MLCPSCNSDAGEISKFCPSCGAAIVRAAEADDLIGKIIARKFRVEQMIGEGGMGKVYRAKQIALDKPVVLKVLRQSLLSDERTVARFQREAKAASRLNHANSISVLDFGQAEDGALYIAMEFVAGKDLHQILSKEWPLPEARVVRIVSQVLSALADAHSAGVIHRDLKPENIMVEQRRGEPDFVKVLDFGIAKIQDSTGDDGPALTRAGFVCGTPEYMSPEQARGASLDHRSDLYAVGVILYQLTSGMLPFDSDSAVGFATKHLTEEPPAPTVRRPDARISPGMERLILKALCKDPNDRPQTAESFKAELLQVDKERRQANSARRSQGLSSPVLQPLPRKVTPSEDAATRIGAGEPTWGPGENTNTAEQTVRTTPDSLIHKGGGQRNSTTETPTQDNSLFLFKAITVGLVLTSLGLGGYFIYSTKYAAHADTKEDYSQRSNVPMPADKRPLYDQDIPESKRDLSASAVLEHEGDEQHQRGNLEAAAQKYRSAFEKNPSTDLSLKLGEVMFQNGDQKEAKGWWARHLRDESGSKARRYIQEALGELTN